MSIKLWVDQQLNVARQHLDKADKTYPEHLKTALWFSYKCFSAGCLAATHGIFPHVFTSDGTRAIDELYFILHPKDNVKKHLK